MCLGVVGSIAVAGSSSVYYGTMAVWDLIKSSGATPSPETDLMDVTRNCLINYKYSLDSYGFTGFEINPEFSSISNKTVNFLIQREYRLLSNQAYTKASLAAATAATLGGIIPTVTACYYGCIVGGIALSTVPWYCGKNNYTIMFEEELHKANKMTCQLAPVEELEAAEVFFRTVCKSIGNKSFSEITMSKSFNLITLESIRQEMQKRNIEPLTNKVAETQIKNIKNFINNLPSIKTAKVKVD